MPTVKITHVETADLHNFVMNRHGHTTDETDPVYVELDLRTGAMTAVCRHYDGGAKPTPVGHGHVQWWSIKPMRAEHANALLDELRPLAQRAVDGYLGGRLGDPARLTSAAETAIGEAADVCARAAESTTPLKAWRAADWYGGTGSREAQRRELEITSATTDERLAEIVAADESSDECDLVDGGLEYLQGLRAEAPR